MNLRIILDGTLPFAQIATRICGALILIVASILTKVLL